MECLGYIPRNVGIKDTWKAAFV